MRLRSRSRTKWSPTKRRLIFVFLSRFSSPAQRTPHPQSPVPWRNWTMSSPLSWSLPKQTRSTNSTSPSLQTTLIYILFKWQELQQQKRKARFKCILDRISNAFQTHLKRVAGKAFESISDRLRNAPEMRLWQRVLQTRWPGPPTVTQGRRKKKKKKERSTS